MGEEHFYQPLTQWDKTTVILYRSGIALATSSVLAAAVFFEIRPQNEQLLLNIFFMLAFISIGISVFFIHLYVSSFHRFLKRLFYLSFVALAALVYLSKGNPAGFMETAPYGFILLLPISGCLGFITAKEAFCFRLTEGYLLAIAMPLYLFTLATGALTRTESSYGLWAIALLLVFFSARKVFMPLHYDIGDKSAYQ